MATRLFGQFLLERGVISRDALLDVVKCQKSINLPLAALAVENGYLSREQIAWLDTQPRGSDKVFMELVLQKGILTVEQLENLSKQRSSRWIFLGEALVQRGYLTLAQLNDLFELYRKEQIVPDADVLPIPPGVVEKELISSMIKVTADIFLHYTKQLVKVLSIERVTNEPGDITYLFTQRITGEKAFCYGLAMSEPLTLTIASKMLQEEAQEINALVLDAVTEFVNVVVGNGCAKLSMSSARVSAEPPQVMLKEMLSRILPKDSVAVRMQTEKGEFTVFFVFNPGSGEKP